MLVVVRLSGLLLALLVLAMVLVVLTVVSPDQHTFSKIATQTHLKIVDFAVELLPGPWRYAFL